MPKNTFFNLSEEKQEKVMRAAISEFSKNGFEKGNVGNIAKYAGIAKGSMYQYFENKRELFLYSVEWATKLVIKKYSKYITIGDSHINIFDYFYESSKEMWSQLNDEREVVIFLQDVFLGKYSSLTDESMAYMMKPSDEYILKMIKDGKRNGSIRKDIDDNLLYLFLIGVSFKFKEYIMKKARTKGEDIIDEDFEAIDMEIKSVIELLKNGMGAK